jgi:phosphatidylglycerophosphatase A
MGRPGLVADELLGMTIANYIAGAKGIFEFIRFDQAKPGILKKLGPIVNDAVGGLIAGVSSNMYTKAISEASKRSKQ